MSEHSNSDSEKPSQSIQSRKSQGMDIKKLTMLALFAAIAYALMLIGRIPVILFLKYDPKDVIILIAGFIYGPMSVFLISVVVSFLEMMSVSDTGIWGLIMNILSTCAFACPAAFIYKKYRNINGATIGIIVGAVLAVGVMMLWNYLIAPIYMKVSREDIAALLLTAFLPFNILKSGINATLTIILYKPFFKTLRLANIIPESEQPPDTKAKTVGVLIVAAVLLITFILLWLVLAGKI